MKTNKVENKSIISKDDLKWRKHRNCEAD